MKFERLGELGLMFGPFFPLREDSREALASTRPSEPERRDPDPAETDEDFFEVSAAADGE